MTAKRRLGTTGYYVVSILIAVVAMIPFLWMISTSLKSRGALMSIPIEWIPAEPSLDAYGEVFSRFPFLKTIGNSLFISVSYTIITLISASMAAFAFAKIKFRCANLLLKLYLATMMIPTQVTMIPLFVIMNKLGLIDSYASVILPSIFRPFAVFMLVQQMRTVPADYLDAARVDGANIFQVYSRVALPLCAPTLATLAVTTFMELLERLPLASADVDRPGQDDPAHRPVHTERPVQYRVQCADGRQPDLHDPNYHHLPVCAEALQKRPDGRRHQGVNR